MTTDDDLYETNGSNARQWRKRAGKRQDQISGVCVRTISKIEHGSRVSAASLRAYAKAVGLKGDDGWIELLSEGEKARQNLVPAPAEKPDRQSVASDESAVAGQFKRVRLGLAALIDSSTIPMYFADTRLAIRASNQPFRELIGAGEDDLTDMPIREVLLKYSIHRIPLSHREVLEKRQMGLIDRFLDRQAHSTDPVLIDNRHLPSGKYKGLGWRCWVNADKVTAGTAHIPVGLFVIFHAEALSEEAFARLEALDYEDFRSVVWTL